MARGPAHRHAGLGAGLTRARTDIGERWMPVVVRCAAPASSGLGGDIQPGVELGLGHPEKLSHDVVLGVGVGGHALQVVAAPGEVGGF